MCGLWTIASRPRGGRPHAFTLVELLVVLGLIIVLAGLVLAVLMHSRGKARQAACANNLRHIMSAIRMYAEDYNGKAPDCGFDWDSRFGRRGQLVWVLDPYLRDRRVWFCPADPYAGKPVVEGNILHAISSYHTFLLAFGYDFPVEEHSIYQAVVVDGAYWGRRRYWHFGGFNAAFTDGSVKWLPPLYPDKRYPWRPIWEE